MLELIGSNLRQVWVGAGRKDTFDHKHETTPSIMTRPKLRTSCFSVA
jgi:hypothetical protein